MTKTNQEISLASTRDIPFNKLVLSQANVRTIKTGVSIEDRPSPPPGRGLPRLEENHRQGDGQ